MSKKTALPILVSLASFQITMLVLDWSAIYQYFQLGKSSAGYLFLLLPFLSLVSAFIGLLGDNGISAIALASGFSLGILSFLTNVVACIAMRPEIEGKYMGGCAGVSFFCIVIIFLSVRRDGG